MMDINIHEVKKIELIRAYPANYGSRTIRVTHTDFLGAEVCSEFTLYGNTAALDLLPRSPDFREHHDKVAAE